MNSAEVFPKICVNPALNIFGSLSKLFSAVLPRSVNQTMNAVKVFTQKYPEDFYSVNIVNIINKKQAFHQ
jgi:hypothetical protein